MPFQKGHTINIGRVVSPKTRAKIGAANTGRAVSAEARAKMSAAKKGKAPWNVGLPATWVLKGEDSPHWKGGVTPWYKKIRKSKEYKAWRLQVFERDSYICTMCSKVGGDLEADHIKRFADYPELRFDVDNGRTLCKPCHRQTDTWGNYKTTKGLYEEV